MTWAHVRFEPDSARVRSVLAQPVRIGDRRIGNSLAIHPMEGCDGELDGRPGDLTWRRYKRFAAGGAKLLWFEATAICREGRANPRQLWINPNTEDDYARLIDTIRNDHAAAFGTADDLLVPMQLTHSGRYSYPDRIIAYHNPDRPQNQYACVAANPSPTVNSSALKTSMSKRRARASCWLQCNRYQDRSWVSAQ